VLPTEETLPFYA